MGAWDISISSNDDYQDCYEDLIKKINQGISLEEAFTETYRVYMEEFDGEEFSVNNLIYALAYGAWEYGLNDDSYLKQAKTLLEERIDEHCMRELGLTEQEVSKRIKILSKFIKKISVPKTKPKKAKKIVYKPAIFRKGDILSIRTEKGMFTGAIVLEDAKIGEEYGHNYILKCNYSSDIELSLEMIMEMPIYNISWYAAIGYKKYIKQITVIDNIEIAYDYSECNGVGSTYSGWITFVSDLNENAVSIKENADIKSIKDFLTISPDIIQQRNKNEIIKDLKSWGIL